MACLGEESRFRLVQALIGGARCVTDLASEVGLSQSCTTRHLQALERRRLVSGRRDGKRVLYRIRDDDPGLMPLLRWALDHPTGSIRPAARPGASGSARPDGRTVSEPVTRAEPDLARSLPAGPGAQEGAEPLLPAVPQPVRRNGGSEIEDYLL